MSQLSLFDSNIPPTPWTDLPFLVVDTETTGLNPAENRVIEIAWVLFEKQQEISSEARLCSISEPLPPVITQLTGIHSDMLEGQPTFEQHICDFLTACSKASFLVAYNANFDRQFIEHEFKRAGKTMPELAWVDPCVYIRQFDRYEKGKKLTQAAARWGVKLEGAHRALADAKATGHLLVKMMPRLLANSLEDLIAVQNKWQQEQERQYQAYRARQG